MFSTEFPVESSNTIEQLYRIAEDWISGSPHTSLEVSEISISDTDEHWVLSNSDESVRSIQYRGEFVQATSLKYIKKSGGLEWVSTITMSVSQESAWVGIRVSCESFLPSSRLPPAKKPIIAELLLEKLSVGKDGPLHLLSKPHYLDDIEIPKAGNILSGKSACYLPVVYISANYDGRYAVDCEQIAIELAGMAHVLVEPNRHFSNRLRSEVDSQNVYGGSIGIYWPLGSGRRSVFHISGYDSPKDLKNAICNELRTALVNRRSRSDCTWSSVQEKVSKKRLDHLRNSGSEDLKQFIEEFDQENEAARSKLKEAELEIVRLQNEVYSLECRVLPSENTGVMASLGVSFGNEQELYPGEFACVLVESCSSQLHNSTEDSRRKHLLQAVADDNQAANNKVKREEIKEILRNYTKMSPTIRKQLQAFGFAITEDGRHFKLVYADDDRYTFILPKSGSDHRGGLNAAGDIARLLF